MASEITTVENAFNLLSEGLQNQKKYKVGSFKDFLRNIWCQSFDHPEYFQAWHVGVLADDIEECLRTGQNYVAILPRFHFKSTLLGHAFSVWRLLTAPRDCTVLYLSYSDEGEPLIKGLKRVSKPGLRVYVNKGEIPTYYGGLGTSIISTSKGLMTGKQAWIDGIGGEILLYVY